jgi:hypothetical protein
MGPEDRINKWKRKYLSFNWYQNLEFYFGTWIHLNRDFLHPQTDIAHCKGNRIQDRTVTLFHWSNNVFCINIKVNLTSTPKYPMWVLPSRLFDKKNVYLIITCPMLATCPVHLTFLHMSIPILFFVALSLNAGHDLLILEVSRSHTTTHHSR